MNSNSLPGFSPIAANTGFTRPSAGKSPKALQQPLLHFEGDDSWARKIVNNPSLAVLAKQKSMQDIAIKIFLFAIAVSTGIGHFMSPSKNHPTGSQVASATYKMESNTGLLKQNKDVVSIQTQLSMTQDFARTFVKDLSVILPDSGGKIGTLSDLFQESPLSEDELVQLNRLLLEKPESLGSNSERFDYYMDFLTGLGEKYLPEAEQQAYVAELNALRQDLVEYSFAHSLNSAVTLGTLIIPTALVILGRGLYRFAEIKVRTEDQLRALETGEK